MAAGCGGGGGGSSLGDQDVATVGSIHIKRARYEELIGQKKRQYQQSGRAFPRAGTQEYAQIKSSAVTYLVQAAEREQRAEDMGIKVTDSEVESRLKQIKKQYFQGSDKRYQQQLKKQGLTDAQIRADLKAQLIYEKVFKKITAPVKVGDDEIHEYYLQHSQTYARPQSREVRHILISTTGPTSSLKKKLTTAQAKQLADKIYAQLKAGANFATLAKKYSDDPGSKDTGGKLTVSRGQTVPQFDATAFTLKTNEISKPVKTQYGWHIIEALSKIRPPSATPEKQVRDSIREQLLQTKKNEAVQKWVDDTYAKLNGKVKYAVGFKPAATTPSVTTG